MADYDLFGVVEGDFSENTFGHLTQFQALFRFAVDRQDLANLVGMIFSQ